MLIFDTLSKTKKSLQKSKKPLKLFVCGPTTYDYSHIGHARTYIIFDAFVKYLRSINIKVFYLQNITDVDDKIIARAKTIKMNPLALAKKFEHEYYKDLKNLRVSSANKYATASKFIPQIVSQVERLIKKNYAYKIERDGYYFDISKFSDYGKLSRRTAEQANDATSRIDDSIKKRNKGDFALWKFNKQLTTDNKRHSKTKFQIAEDGEPSWWTPLGWGRPGWHIEDTAITEKFFGPQYDIHGGGVDLKFPHHEAEIAQQESISGKKPLVKIWMHTGFLLVDGEKMSKSLNNFITIRDFLKKYPPDILRLMIFSNHYRSPFNYTDELAQSSQKSLNGIREFLEKLDFISKKGVKNKKLKIKGVIKIAKYQGAFKKAIEDDFNTPKALAVIFELISEAQKNIWSLPPSKALKIVEFIQKQLKIFEIGVVFAKTPLKIIKMAEQREKFRSNKHFVQADQLRKRIEMLGYIIEDTPLGPFVKRKE